MGRYHTRNHQDTWYSTNYQRQCKLERTTCIAPGCKTQTILWPLCAHHATDLVGITVKQSPSPGRGCGLFATRNIRSSSVLAPYVGHTRSEEVANITHSPYLIPNPRNAKMVVDASCRRGYAAMSNHSPTPNCYLYITSIDTKANGRGRWTEHADGWHVPRVLCHSTLTRGPMVWLITIRDVRMGEELCIDYGPYAAEINDIRHSTLPALCR